MKTSFRNGLLLGGMLIALAAKANAQNQELKAVPMAKDSLKTAIDLKGMTPDQLKEIQKVYEDYRDNVANIVRSHTASMTDNVPFMTFSEESFVSAVKMFGRDLVDYVKDLIKLSQLAEGSKEYESTMKRIVSKYKSLGKQIGATYFVEPSDFAQEINNETGVKARDMYAGVARVRGER